ncbi:MAG: PDZ domain-containing protein [Pirellulaceae bacterium]|nr:PDZ domain-containing protein [Pirellulaceae bacterium]
MRKSFFKFWVSTAAVWAAVASFGSRLQAQQAETKEFAFVISNDEDGAEQEEQAEAPKFWLGIALKPVEGDLATYIGSTDGVLVDSVYPDSPASKAGLEKGDIVVAVGEQKLTDPKSLLAQMLTIKTDDEGKAPALKLKVLRKGESKAIELTPVARPAEMKVTVNAEGVNLLTDDVKGAAEFSFDLNNKSPEEIEKMVEDLHGSNVRILRFGTPTKLPGDPKGIIRMEIHKSVDGKNLEISIHREGEGPAKVTVKQEGETKEYSSDKMDEMPEDIRKTVTEMLDKKGKITVQGRKLSAEEKANVDGKQVKDHIAEIKNRIALIAPTGNFEIAKVMDKEMAEKVSEMAKEIAARAEQSSKWAQAAAAMPEEVKELKSQVESLRAEIKELRDQLKATLKSTSDK